MRLTGLRVLVAGAGVVGSAVALTLRRQGATVVLTDPDPPEGNASLVAAGMLAPALEAVLDLGAGEHFPLFRAARDIWPDFAAGMADDGGLGRSGSLWVGSEQSQAEVRDRLIAVGATAEIVTGIEAEAMAEGLKAGQGAVYTPEDWRVDPRTMLGRLRDSLRSLGGVRRRGLLASTDGSSATFMDGDRLETDAVVLATGLAPIGLRATPPELAWLEPVKGQILCFADHAPRAGPSVRGEGIYVCPSQGGCVAGATMEPGLTDRRVDSKAVARLHASAATLFPALAPATPTGAAGVRSATPDGLPMVGPSSAPGVFLAMGARRNGWLLAPLMAQVLSDQLAGAEPGPWAGMFRPARFGLSPPG